VVAHLLWEQEVGGSSPPSPTGDELSPRGRSSMVEPQPSKLVMPVRSRSPARPHPSGRSGSAATRGTPEGVTGEVTTAVRRYTDSTS
jgi:hypothetical protein